MNSVVLKPTGNLEINGTDVGLVSGFRIKTSDCGRTKITVQFDVDSLDIEFSAEDFRINHLPLSTKNSD